MLKARQFIAAIILIVISLCFTLPSRELTAWSYFCDLPDTTCTDILKWKDKKIDFYINRNSFNNLNGLNLTNNEKEYWVAAAAAPWRDATSALKYTYKGNTTTSCKSKDNKNTIEAINGYLNFPHCNALATTTVRYNTSTKFISEIDICIAETPKHNHQNKQWAIQLQEINTGKYDLITVLTHEFGHAWGLGHSDKYKSVLVDSLEPNEVLRTLTRDDIIGIRALYSQGTPYNSQWSNHSSSSLEYNNLPILNGGDWLPANGAIGRINDTNQITLTRTSWNSSKVYFSRTLLPLIPNTSPPYNNNWTNLQINTETYLHPAVAATTELQSNSTWVAAWALPWPDTRQIGDDHINGHITINRSTNGFSSGYTKILTCKPIINVYGNSEFNELCTTSHAPSLTYDSTSKRFILLYLSDTNYWYADQIYKIIARTSLDGINWTEPQDLNRRALNTPSITCRNSLGCQIAFTSEYSNSVIHAAKKVNVSSSGVISLTPATGGFYNLINSIWSPGSGSNSILLPNYHWLNLWQITTSDPHSISDIANSKGSATITISTDIPINSSNFLSSHQFKTNVYKSVHLVTYSYFLNNYTLQEYTYSLTLN